jgi:hypothetical protein
MPTNARLQHFSLLLRVSSNLLAARRVARSDLRNLGLLSVDLLHINAILLRSCLRLLIVLFIMGAGSRPVLKLIM